jgi:hypothetical protein
MQAISLRFLADLHLAQGDAEAALDCCAQSRALHQDLSEPLDACWIEAIAAQCALSQGRLAEAQVQVDATLDRLPRELADYPAHATIELRWDCHAVLLAVRDDRAGPLLEQLHSDVQATAVARTDAADRDRLIQAIPTFRAVFAAHGQRRGSDGPH